MAIQASTKFLAAAAITTSLIFAGDLVPASFATIAPEENKAVTPTVEIDRPVILKGDKDPVFILVRFRASELSDEQNKDRPPLNLSLVLDRSGSMADTGKMDYLKQASKMAVDRLTSADYLSIVEYDDEITVMWPSQKVESVFPIKRLIDSLDPRGSTNLVGGMMKGADEVSARMKTIDAEKAINRVLLLSDGLANEGVQEPEQIRRLVRAAKAEGVRISTMGLGRDYDEDLMQDIAENAGGNYYYIEHPNQMARIFEQELQTLFTTVAKDVTFEFDPASGIKDVEVVSFGAANDPEATKFDMENFYAGEERTILLRLEPEDDLFKSKNASLDLGDITFTYQDVKSQKTVSFEADVEVKVTDDEAEVSQAQNHDVIVEANLFESERKHKEAIKQYEAGNYEEAEKQMTDLENVMREQNAVLKDARLANKLEALQVEKNQMSASADSVEDRSLYLKSTKQRLYKAQKGSRKLYLMQVGDKGYEVERLQTALQSEGYYTGPIDGIFTEEVKSAIEKLQADESLAVDGIAGPSTMQSLGLY